MVVAMETFYSRKKCISNRQIYRRVVRALKVFDEDSFANVTSSGSVNNENNNWMFY